MISHILIGIVVLVGLGGLVLALRSIKRDIRQMHQTAPREETAIPPIGAFACGGWVEHRLRLVGECAESFCVPAHILHAQAEPLHFDTWMRARTERAHAEFMERTSRRLPCDASAREVASYMRGSRA